MRYLPHTPSIVEEMLDDIGVQSIHDLFPDLPKSLLKEEKDFDLPKHQNELEIDRFLTALSEKNLSAAKNTSFLGAGCYHHHIPATVDYLIQRSEFLTAYTPYQPEVSQGTLTAMFEFQSYIAALTGMDIANASMYDGATSMVEAAFMSSRLTKHSNVYLATPLHPHYKAVLHTYWQNIEGEIQELSDKPDDKTACLIVQNPDFYGNVHDLTPFEEQAKTLGAKLVVVTTEVVSLGLLPAPEGADIVCGDAQSLGVPMSFGGPSLGFFACKKDYMRHIPGRIVGQTTDSDGQTMYTLTLNTREQHIRRERATSNICTNVGLCALAFTIHLSLLGKNGFMKLAQVNHQRACLLHQELSKIKNIAIENDTFFNEFTIKTPCKSEEIIQKMEEKGILAGYACDTDKLLVCATEMTRKEDIDLFCTTLEEILA